MAEVLIRTEDLRFDYDDAEEGRRALDGVSLNIEEGSFVAVVGRNGSGKSTLAKQFNAILVPAEGKVFVKGLDTSDEANTLEVRRTVSMVFQNPDNQLVSSVVEDDVAFGPENLGVDPKEIRERVDMALKAVD
ncbi:MAG: ATP-binding cassette domain-containing protein, partial [Firmicutes bacterium]|nr:ATP-binding cassette domain-containing protein [Bacillota bacterium]